MKLWDLYRGKDFDIKPSLERIKKALSYIGNPQRAYPSILVGGTNGKGSTCAFLESILRHHGYKTGWFVSPHLVEENERWRIRGVPISDEELNWYVKDLKRVFEKFSLTYFEAATLIALKLFADKKVDVAVMEVGMGGRWDATKASEPLMACVTNAERDHTRWLGKNVEEIAYDKLYLSENVDIFVVGSPRYPLYPKALEMGLRCFAVAGLDFTYWGVSESGRTLLKDYRFGKYHFSDLELGLLGRWQADNGALALTLALLFTDLEEKKLREALGKTKWEGRMEVLRRNPLLLVDGSHNPYAVGKVVKEVKKLFGEVLFLFTGLKGKDWETSMEVIRRYSDKIALTEISYHRGEGLRKLYQKAKELGFRKILLLDSPQEAVSLEEDVCALGSLYLVGEIKSAFASEKRLVS